MAETAASGGCCRCCCRVIFTLGLTSLFLWLSMRTSSPNCLLDQFYIPALNKTLNSPNLTTLDFELMLKNTNKDKGVYYDPINVTFFDSQNRSHFIGNYTIPKFYQGHKKKAKKNGTVPNIDLKAVRLVVPVNGSPAVLRVDLAASVRFKILVFKTKRQKIRVGANVEVHGTTGSKVYPKDLKLKSNGVKIWSYYCGQMVILMANFFVLSSLNLL